ncbi:hypothetical protein Tco_1255560 [Tanacetum coccineum]
MPFPLSAILGGGVGEKSDELELNNCSVNCSKGTLSKVTGLMEFRVVGAGMGMSRANPADIFTLVTYHTYQSYLIEEDMPNEETKSSMREFTTNDQANYYSGITSITVNGKNAYELKGLFIEDLHENAFSGTKGEDAVKHIEYFLRIVDPIDLPNVNHDKLRVVVFPISLKLGRDEIEPTNEEPSDLEETNHDDEQEIGEIFRTETNLFDYETPLCKKFKEFNYLLKIDPDFLTKDIEGFKTYEDYKDDWIYEWNKDIPWVHEKPWMDYGNGGYCNGGNFPGAYIIGRVNAVEYQPFTLIGNSLHYQDYEWYEALEDSELKDEALRNKAIIEGILEDDVESCYKGWRTRYDCGDSVHDHEEREYVDEQDTDDEEYDEKYVAIKEDEYDDLAKASEEACRAYQEIFRMMDEGWMVTRDE